MQLDSPALQSPQALCRALRHSVYSRAATLQKAAEFVFRVGIEYLHVMMSTIYKKLLQEDTCFYRDCVLCRKTWKFLKIPDWKAVWKSWRSWLDKVMSAGPEHYTTVRWCVRKPIIPPGGWLQQLRFKLCWFHNFIRSKLESPWLNLTGFLLVWKFGAGPKSDGIRWRPYKNILYIPRWWFQIFFIFTLYLGKIPILTHIFQRGWFNHQLDTYWNSGTHWKRDFLKELLEFEMFFSALKDVKLNCMTQTREPKNCMLIGCQIWNPNILERHAHLGGGNSHIFGMFTLKIEEDEPNLTCAYFSDGLVQPMFFN